MERIEIINCVKKGFKEIFPEEKFELDKQLDQFENWDSFSHIRLVSKIQEEFKITLEMKEVIELDSIKKFIEIIDRNLNEKSKLNKCKGTQFKNFSEVLNHWADEAPDKTFVHNLSTNKSYTYFEFNKFVNATIRLLEAQGVRKGDIVSICIRNSSEFLIIYFASIRLGSIINPLPFNLSGKELNKTFEFVQPKIIVLEKFNNDKVSEKFRKFKTLIIEYDGDNSFVNQLKTYSDSDIIKNIDNNSPVCLYYSSGTTSDPKGVLYSSYNMINLIGSICRGFNHSFETVHFGMLPMGHTAITNYSILPVAYAGGTLVFAENFIKIKSSFWDIIEKYKVTYVETVPTILFSLLNKNYPNYSKNRLSLKYVGCGSAPLPSSVQKGFQEKFGLPVANLYGLSETGPSHIDNPINENWKPGSIGFPLDINECKIIDENFEELPVGEIGEMVLKGPNVFIGYFKNDEAYNKVMKYGFFLTGDLGYKDEKGRFFYFDRKKKLIIKCGVNIFPGEIDEILFKHSSVLEASTIGVPDIFFGEEIVSFVVRKDKENKDKKEGAGYVTEEELLEHCLQHLQGIKCPKKIIFLESIPQTNSGKLLRKKLRELYDKKYDKKYKLRESKIIENFTDKFNSEKCYEKELETAILAVKTAGKSILQHFKSKKRIIRKSAKELVTRSDLESQNIIVKILSKEFPNYDVLCEEKVNLSISSKPTWVIDPIDGTHNFISGIPLFGVSIGLLENSEFKLGVIYFPLEDKIFTAVNDHGAFCNGKKIGVSDNKELANAVITYDNQFYLDSNSLKNYKNLVDKTFTTRILGAATRDFCFISDGVVDGRIWNHTKLVDIVAGSVILWESGGKVTDFKGNKINVHSKQVVASNGLIHDQLLDLLND